MSRNLRDLLNKEGLIVAPGCFDALTGRIAESLGFPAVYLGGYSMGSSNCITEPLMTMTEIIREAEFVAQACNIPLIVDAGGGFGDATHTMRCIKEFMRAGVAAVHIEDQLFPKRAHYHAGVKYVLPKEDMVAKIKAAVRARGDSDFVIIARTDAREALNGGKEDAIERCKLFRQAGADVIMPYATSAPSFEESREMYETIQAPLLYVSTEGRPGYAKLSKDQIEQAGFKIVIYNLIGTFSAARAVYEAMKNLKETGDSGWSHEEMNPTRKMIESLIGLPELYEIEKLYRQV